MYQVLSVVTKPTAGSHDVLFAFYFEKVRPNIFSKSEESIISNKIELLQRKRKAVFHNVFTEGSLHTI
jgi:hypothetical protein